MRRLRRRSPRRPLTVGAVASMLLLAGCGLLGGEMSTPVIEGRPAGPVGPAPPEPGGAAPTVEVQCDEITQDDCEQAVSAIVNGLPYGYGVVQIEIGPLEERLQITPEPAWSASARAVMSDGFVYDLVIFQEVRPGPMEINFAPED